MNEYMAPDTLSNLMVVESYNDLVEIDQGAHSHTHTCNLLGVVDADTDIAY